MYFLPTLLVLLLATPRPTTAFPFTKSDWDDPASSSLGAQLLYSNNNNNNNNVLQISGNNQPVNGNPIACKSDSGDSLNFSSIGKRGIEMCPPTWETIPDKKSTPAQPILKDVDRPLRFMSPDSLSPLKTDPLADDDDKCPTRLMKMSKIPVCDSGKLGRDSMRLSGETTYTLFNIRPCMPLLHLYSYLPFDRLWSCILRIRLIALFCSIQILTRIRACGRVNRGVALQPGLRLSRHSYLHFFIYVAKTDYLQFCI